MPIPALIYSLAVAGLWLGQAHAQSPQPADSKPARPTGEALRVNAVSPALMQVLKNWENSSKNIKKLEGEHRRWEYDYVFKVVKRNNGVFYYEAPDKGRIDLKPTPNPATNKGAPPPTEEKTHWQTGTVIKVQLQPGSAERYFCDGQIVTQVDDVTRTATRIIIPKENQGANITEGPLPFLFGMPADKAIRRYDMTLLNVEKDKNGKPIKAWLEARPRMPVDRSNYQLATIILDLNTYLPDAVRMIDPAGTKETAFKFVNLKVNPNGLISKVFGNNPFKLPDSELKDYKVTIKAPVDDGIEQLHGSGGHNKIQTVEGTRPANGPSPKSRPLAEDTKPQKAVPSVVGLHWEDAKRLLERAGYVVARPKFGDLADDDEQVHCVQRQTPEPKTALPAGETVTLWLYITEKDIAKAKAAAKPE